jgi:quinol monooxygenase YgiN
MQFEISSQERELLMEVLESWRDEARTEAHRTLDAAFKRKLKDKLSLAEDLLGRLSAPQTLSAGA